MDMQIFNELAGILDSSPQLLGLDFFFQKTHRLPLRIRRIQEIIYKLKFEFPWKIWTPDWTG
jgi:hypothetical protein